MAEPDNEDAARLRRWREWAGLSQPQLAARLAEQTGNPRFSRQQLSSYECGVNGMSLAIFREICAALGIAPAEYFGTIPKAPRAAAQRRRSA